MNKKHLLTIVAFSFLLTLAVLPAKAATPTPTNNNSPTPKPTPNAKVEDLKERLATKVAELRQVERRALYGKVKSVSLTSITVETQTKDIKIELTDDIHVAQMVKGKRTELTSEDIAKGDTLTVIGEYDVTLDLLKAQVVFIQDVLPKHLVGVVREVDRKNFTLTIADTNKQSYIIDIETNTKTKLWDLENGLVKSGFSKITQGETLHIVGSANTKEENRLSAIRILNLGNIFGAPSVTNTPTPTEEESPTPSTSPKPTATKTSTNTPTPEN